MEPEAERKRRLSAAQFVVDTTPFKTALQKPNPQARRRSRGNVGITNRETRNNSDVNPGAHRNPRFTQLPTTTDTIKTDEKKKVTFAQQETTHTSTKSKETSKPVFEPDCGVPKASTKPVEENRNVTTAWNRNTESPTQTIQVPETNDVTVSTKDTLKDAGSSNRTTTFQERTSWSIPRHSTKVPLRSLLLDPSVNTLTKHTSYSAVKASKKRVNQAHPSYDIDGDGIVGPGDMALARRCDTEGLGKLTTEQLRQSRAERGARSFQENQDNLWLFSEDMVEKTVRENVESLFTRCSDPKKFALAVLNFETKERALKSVSSSNMKMCISGIEDCKKDDLTHKEIQPPLLISSTPREEQLAKESAAQKMYSTTHSRVFGDSGRPKKTLFERQREFTQRLAQTNSNLPQNHGTRSTTQLPSSSVQPNQIGMRRCRTRSELQAVRHREKLRNAESLYKAYGKELPMYDNKKVGLVDFMIAPPEKQHRGLDRVLQSLLLNSKK